MSSAAVKPRRVRSARARLTPTQPLDTSSSLAKEALERQASAKAIREKHNGSDKVFPRPKSRGSKERFSTMYSKDFDGAYAPAADLRPTSPTRRHNPHPGKVGEARRPNPAPPTFACGCLCVHRSPKYNNTRCIMSTCPFSFSSNSWCGDCLTERLGCLLNQRVWSCLQSISPETVVGCV